MGTGLFNYIAQACQSLAATAAPSITAMGVHIVIALATIMLVWFGVQEALASAHGGPGFSMGRFLNLFMLLTFAYAMVNYYDSSIPGLGFSIKGFIDGGTINLVNLIGADGSITMLNEIHTASGQDRTVDAEQPDESLLRHRVLRCSIPVSHCSPRSFRHSWPMEQSRQRSSDSSARSSSRFLSSTSSIGCSGDGSRHISGSAFTRCVAAATLNVLAHVLTQLLHPTWPELLRSLHRWCRRLPLLILLVLVNIYILFKIPTMTHSLFTGGTGGHGGGLGWR